MFSKWYIKFSSLFLIFICIEGIPSFQQKRELSEYFAKALKLLPLLKTFGLVWSYLFISLLFLSKFLGVSVSPIFTYSLKFKMFYYSICHMQTCMCMCIFSLWLIHHIIQTFFMLIVFVCVSERDILKFPVVTIIFTL